MNTTDGIQRGDIYWVTMDGKPKYHVQGRSRPAIIVSNDKNNRHSLTVEVVFLTTKDKGGLPTHTAINSAAKPSTALCEQIQTVGIEQLEQYVGRCTAEEMAAIDRCLLISLGLDVPCAVGEQKNETTPHTDTYEEENPFIELLKVKAERDLLRQFFTEIINR